MEDEEEEKKNAQSPIYIAAQRLPDATSTTAAA